MAKKQRHEEHEEHADETWLIPYADLLTLLLALFIVLFASSQVDQKKLEKMSQAMQSAFDGSRGVMEFFGVVEPKKNIDPSSKNKKSEDTQGPQTQPSSGQAEEEPKDPEEAKQQAEDKAAQEQLAEAKLQEQQDLHKLKEELDSYINANGLTTQLETTLADHYVMITIRDNALFASGSADRKSVV